MKKIIIATASSFALFAASAAPALAATYTYDGPRPFADLGELIGSLIIVLFAAAALIAFVFVIIGGIQWITAGGDKMAAQSARDRITAAVVGLIIVIAAFGITLLITQLLGIDIFEAITFPAGPDVLTKP